MRCPKCNIEIPAGVKFCSECGTRISQISGQTSGPWPGTRPSGRSSSDLRSSVRIPPPSGGSTVFVPPTPSSPFPPGKLLAGRWQLEGERGRGGMGVVYRARDAKLRTRTVAVKILSEQLEGSREGIERFIREAETVAGLNHQSIVQVLDVGEGEGRHFIVMEWIEGEDLGEILESGGAWDLSRAIPVLREVFQAVGYAHRHSVVHRDLKPSNILITRDGHAKIVDFGLARMATESDLSKSGYGLGTLAYMSPEQRRDAKRADHRSDIYALGKTVYHILTGQVPDPVDPEALPLGVRPAIMRALKPQPSDRWFSVEEFWQAIEEGRAPEEPSPGHCPECGHVNPEEGRFCRECGAGLFANCPACGHEDRIGTRFCQGCGVNIQDEKEYRDHLAQAEKYLEEYKYSRARKEAQRAMEIRPQAERAREILEEAREKAERLGELGRRYQEGLEHGRFDEAERSLRAALELAPQDEGLLSGFQGLPRARTEWEVAHLQAELDKQRKAKEWPGVLGAVDQIEASVEASGIEWAEGSNVARILKQARELRGRVEKCVRQVESWLSQAHELMTRGRHEEAGELLQRAEVEYPASQLLKKLRARLEHRMNDVAGLQESVEEAWRDERNQDVIDIYRKLLKLLPGDEGIKQRRRDAEVILRAERHLHAKRRFRRILLALAILAVIAGGVSIVTFIQANRRHFEVAKEQLARGTFVVAASQLLQSRGLGVPSAAWRDVATATAESLVVTGDDLLDQGEFGRAADHYKAANSLQISVTAEERLIQLDSRVDEELQRLEAEGRRALANGDLQAASSAFRAMIRVRPAAQTRVNALRAEVEAVRVSMDELSATDEQVIPPELSVETRGGLNCLISRVTASSHLAPQTYQGQRRTYEPRNLIDGSLQTAWVEGIQGNGVGEWVRLEFRAEVGIESLVITNGYAVDQARFLTNGRVSKARITMSDGSSTDVDLADVREPRTIPIASSVETKSITLTILAVYPGTKYEDTAISEIEVRGIQVIDVPPDELEPVTAGDSYHCGYELGFEGWSVGSTGRTPCQLSSFAHTGSKSLKIGPSTCPGSCFDKYAVDISKDFPAGRVVREISCWIYEEGNWGGSGYLKINGTQIKGVNLSARDNKERRQPGWVEKKWIVNSRVVRLEFHFGDITKRDPMYLDDVRIDYGASR
ncbi:MAG: protein kinase [Candidatus Eisenbacteria sp.]|nr:protein kinase [Candidatus Eisenbacteria bacterium]